MFKTVEAILEKDGRLRLAERVALSRARRVLVTFLDDAIDDEASDVTETAEAALLSEPALAEDWNRPEEDEAWEHLQ